MLCRRAPRRCGACSPRCSPPAFPGGPPCRPRSALTVRSAMLLGEGLHDHRVHPRVFTGWPPQIGDRGRRSAPRMSPRPCASDGSHTLCSATPSISRKMSARVQTCGWVMSRKEIRDRLHAPTSSSVVCSWMMTAMMMTVPVTTYCQLASTWSRFRPFAMMPRRSTPVSVPQHVAAAAGERDPANDRGADGVHFESRPQVGDGGADPRGKDQPRHPGEKPADHVEEDLVALHRDAGEVAWCTRCRRWRRRCGRSCR